MTTATDTSGLRNRFAADNSDPAAHDIAEDNATMLLEKHTAQIPPVRPRNNTPGFINNIINWVWNFSAATWGVTGFSVMEPWEIVTVCELSLTSDCILAYFDRYLLRHQKFTDISPRWTPAPALLHLRRVEQCIHVLLARCSGPKLIGKRSSRLVTYSCGTLYSGPLCLSHSVVTMIIGVVCAQNSRSTCRQKPQGVHGPDRSELTATAHIGTLHKPGVVTFFITALRSAQTVPPVSFRRTVGCIFDICSAYY